MSLRHSSLRVPSTLLLTLALAPVAPLGAQSAAAPQPGAEPATEVDHGPAERFERLEQRLLTDSLVSTELHITAEGAVDADLRGHLVVERRGGELQEARLVAEGDFAGQEVEVEMTSVDGRLKGTGGQTSFDLDTPPALGESLVIGLTRMGVLHNLALLIAGRPPDHADGGVRDWVTVEDLEGEAEREGLHGTSFGIVVAGQPAGEATLWTHPATELPVERRQTVRFPEGEMRVVERYVFLMAPPAE